MKNPISLQKKLGIGKYKPSLRAKRMTHLFAILTIILSIMVIYTTYTQKTPHNATSEEICTLKDVYCEDETAQTLKIEEKKEIIRSTVTAYSEIDSCHYENCEMSSGNRAYIGAVACPYYLPLYTRVVIDNIPYICEDRVSKKYPDRFDIFMGYGINSYNKAINYGKQEKEIIIYKPYSME